MEGGSWSSLRRGREKYRVGEGGGEGGGGMYILATFSLQCRWGIYWGEGGGKSRLNPHVIHLEMSEILISGCPVFGTLFLA